MQWRRKKQLTEEQLALLAEQKQLLHNIRSKQHKVLNKMLWIGLLGFIIHCFICSTIFLFPDPVAVNEKIYYFLKFLHIPVYSPKGWNINYISGFVLNIGLYTYGFIKSKGLLFRNTMKLDGKGFFCRIGTRFCIFLIIVFFIAISYVTPFPPHSSSCTLHSLCGLQTENQFYFSVFVSYLFFWTAGLTALILSYC